MSNAQLKKVSFRLPASDLQEIDFLINSKKLYPARSDFFRSAVLTEIGRNKEEQRAKLEDVEQL